MLKMRKLLSMGGKFLAGGNEEIEFDGYAACCR